MELETGKFSLRDSLGPNSVFYLCESLMFSHKVLDDSGSKKILNPLLLFALVTSERRAKPFSLHLQTGTEFLTGKTWLHRRDVLEQGKKHVRTMQSTSSTACYRPHGPLRSSIIHISWTGLAPLQRTLAAVQGLARC